jgi:hypothetical protein
MTFIGAQKEHVLNGGIIHTPALRGYWCPDVLPFSMHNTALLDVE